MMNFYINKVNKSLGIRSIHYIQINSQEVEREMQELLLTFINNK